ncbi:hypothetical protein, partial [Stenotrophomonas sp.]|uniref:hypothetical protein n=1 Tax=Stenotrophomonas sp. TaxID=69392 RepID=UPI0028AD6B39
MAWIYWQRRLLERAAVGRWRPWSTQSERSERPAFDFLFLFRGWPRTEIFRGRADGLRRGVSRMDAATELTGT